MEVKTIKGIQREKWILFKMLAARYDVSLGDLFGIVLEDYSKRSGFVWDSLLSGERLLSEEEANEMEKIVKKCRKERGFRI